MCGGTSDVRGCCQSLVDEDDLFSADINKIIFKNSIIIKQSPKYSQIEPITCPMENGYLNHSVTSIRMLTVADWCVYTGGIGSETGS